MSGLAMLSHVSRSVALSMLGYSCLARSYWQRCHKTGLRGAISGEEETVEKLTRRGPYACPVDCFPQALLCTSLTSLHYPLLCLGFKCQDIGLPRAVSPAFPPEQRGVRLEECMKKQLVELESDERRIGFSRCQLKAFFFVMDLEHLILPFNVPRYSQRTHFSFMLLNNGKKKNV